MASQIDHSVHESVLFWLQPISQAAHDVVRDNLARTNRVVKVRRARMAYDMLQVRVEENPHKQRGIISFGRHETCGIRINKPWISLQHCHIDINSSSGELVLHHTGRQLSTWVDQDCVSEPPQRALVPNHVQYLTIGKCEFFIHWPTINKEARQRYRDAKRKAAIKIQTAQALALTELDLALGNEPMTHIHTRAPSPAFTPTRRSPPLEGPGPLEIEMLGLGSSGSAWLAADRLTGGHLVIKKVQSSPRSDKYREIDILCKLKHINILKILGWRAQDDSINIELEYCSAGNMLTLMADLRKDELKMQAFWEQCAQGIEYLHHERIIHRDIKPENILAQRHEGSSYLWKLADFGLSNTFDSAHTVCGTLKYLAPEIKRKDVKQSSSIDIFSFGAVLLDMYCSLKITHCESALTNITLAADVLTRQSVHGVFVKRMVSEQPSTRPSASDCLNYVRDPEFLYQQTQDSAGAQICPRKNRPTPTIPSGVTKSDTGILREPDTNRPVQVHGLSQAILTADASPARYAPEALTANTITIRSARISNMVGYGRLQSVTKVTKRRKKATTLGEVVNSTTISSRSKLRNKDFSLQSIFAQCPL